MKKNILILSLLCAFCCLLRAQDRIHTDYGEVLEATVTKVDGKSVKFFNGKNDAVIPAGRVTEIDFRDGGKFVFQEGLPTVVNPGHFGIRVHALTAEGLLPVSDDLFWKWADKETHFAALQSGRAASRYGILGLRAGALASAAGAVMMSTLSKKKETVTIDVQGPSGYPNTVTVASEHNYSLAGYALFYSGLGVMLDGIGWTVCGSRMLHDMAARANDSARGEELSALKRDIAAAARRDRLMGIAGIAGGTALLGTGVYFFQKNNPKTYYTVRVNDSIVPLENGEWQSMGWGQVTKSQKPTGHLVSIPFFLVGAAALHAGVGCLNMGLTRSRALTASGFGLAWQF